MSTISRFCVWSIERQRRVREIQEGQICDGLDETVWMGILHTRSDQIGKLRLGLYPGAQIRLYRLRSVSEHCEGARVGFKGVVWAGWAHSRHMSLWIQKTPVLGQTQSRLTADRPASALCSDVVQDRMAVAPVGSKGRAL